MTDSGLLMIFAKNPVKGWVKSRLAESIGQQKALVVYRQLLKHTHRVTAALNYPKKVYYSHFIEPDDIWEAAGFDKALQDSGDLGQKMASGFLDNLSDYQKVVIVGSDCPELTKAHLEEAFSQLDSYETVIGPAKDGGYYLLGMRQFIPGLFKQIDWSTSKVLAQTTAILDSQRLSYYLLETLNDIDSYDDLIASPWYHQIKENLST